MKCHEMDLFILEGAPPAASPLLAQQHLTGCLRCQTLLRALSVPVPEETYSSAKLHRLARRLSDNMIPVRPLAPARFYLMAFASVFVAVVALGVYSVGAFALSAMSRVQTATILLALGASATLTAWSLVRQMVPGSRFRLRPDSLPAAVIISLLIVMTCLFQPQGGADFANRGLACLSAGIPFALLAAVPSWLLLRRGAILSPRATGATAGLLAGLAGASVLEIHCSNLDLAHILAWHLGVAALSASIGLAAGATSEIAGFFWSKRDMRR